MAHKLHDKRRKVAPGSNRFKQGWFPSNPTRSLNMIVASDRRGEFYCYQHRVANRYEDAMGKLSIGDFV